MPTATKMLPLSLLLIAATAANAQAPIVINEFQYDDTGTDDREFIELFNTTGVPIDISGWTIACSDASGANPSYVVQPGSIVFPGGYFVLGSALVPGVNQVIGSTNLFENDQEAIQLRDLTATVVDAVVYEASAGTWTGAPAEGRRLFGALVSSDTLPTSWSRLRDGHDTNDNALDFRIMPATPGATNTLASVQPWTQDFDALALDAAVPLWSGSVAPPFAVNPLVISASNPKVLPQASPQGGKAMICTATGGASFMLVDDAENLMWFDSWVYFDRPAPGAPATDSITWSIGVRGTTDSLYAAPDPERLTAVDNNGDTGLTWTYRATNAGATLWLIDNHAGGRGHFLLARIQIPGTGWHRLSLNGTDGRARAFLDGVEYGGAIHQTAGSVYIGVRTVQAGGPLAMYIDDGKTKKGAATIVTPGDPACLGNCPRANETATTLLTESSIAATGRYAFPVTTTDQFEADALCVYSALQDSGSTSNVVVSLFTDASGQPGTLMQASDGGPNYNLSGTLAQPEDDHLLGWLAAPTGPQGGTSPGPWKIPANTSFWVVIDLTDQIHLPIAAEVEGSNGTALTTYMTWDTVNSVWTNAATPAAWTLRWLCTTQSNSKNQWDAGECVLGTTITNIGNAADPSMLIGIDAIGFTELPLNLGFLGLPSCTFFPNPVTSILATPNGVGDMLVPLAVPNAPGLIGLPLVTQWLFVNPFTFTFDASPKARIVIR
ncbi:MAG: lamin tail domain-containing protein [Planctomycetes bacterium]|nr:lamin tail domain-containing protein [Planctomycetota bacterium]